MKFTFLKKYPFQGLWRKDIPLISPKSANLTEKLIVECLENRLLLSVLDFADEIIDEQESNDIDPGQHLDFEGDILALGVRGDLSDGDDIDIYNFIASQDGKIDLMMEITEGGDQEITALAADGEDAVCFIANDSLWRNNFSETDDSVEMLASREEIALAAGLTTGEVILTDLAITPQGDILVTLSGRGDVFSIDGSDGTITQILTSDDIIGITGTSVDLVSIAVAGDGEIYIADNHSGSILQVSEEPEDVYSVAYYAPANQLYLYDPGDQDFDSEEPLNNLQQELLNDIFYGYTITQRTVIAEPDEEFEYSPNAVIQGSGIYGEDGYDVYYTCQLGQAVDGMGGTTDISDGTINQVMINRNDPDDVSFTNFFDPLTNAVTFAGEAMEPIQLNPSALALDTDGAFGGMMFLGTFGPSMGDDQDGRVFTVDEHGDLTEFEITEFNDPVNGEIFTGFFDITDMAFSNGGAFGSYLYVVSENVDQNGAAEGGFESDIWRVSPDGVAELFAADVANGVITLAFSTGADLRYGGDLFVGTFVDGGEIYRITSTGETSLFFTFSPWSNDLALCDMAFAPYQGSLESHLEGAMVFTLKSGSVAYLMQLDPNPVPYEIPNCWAQQLNAGDVSSGDIIFNSDGNLIIAQGGDEDITQLHYETLFDYTLEDIQVRPVVAAVEVEGSDPVEFEDQIVAYTPYVLLSVVDQPRIVGLGEAQQADDVHTEVSVSYLGRGDVPEDGSKNIAFTFDNNEDVDDYGNINNSGDIYIYIQNYDYLLRASRTDDVAPDADNPQVEGEFINFSDILPGSDIDKNTELTDAHISNLTWASDGSLFAVGRNGIELDEDGESPSHVADDIILKLGNTTDNTYVYESLVQVQDLTRLQVAVNGPPDVSRIFDVYPGIPLDISSDQEGLDWDIIPGETYTISISSQTPLYTATEYELMVSLGGQLQQTITIDNYTGTTTLTNIHNESMQVTYTGPGQAVLTVSQRPNGKIVDIESLDISGGGYGSALNFVRINQDAEWLIDEVILNGSLKDLIFPGAVNTITGGENLYGLIWNAELGDVQSVNAPLFQLFDVQVDSLGDETSGEYGFNVLRLRNLDVLSDINNMTFLDSGNSNCYGNITVEGVIRDSDFYGYAIDSLLVKNQDEVPDAIDNSNFHIDNFGGYIRNVTVAEGNVVDSAFNAGRRIDSFEITNGNLEQTSISAPGSGAMIGRVIVNRQDGAPDDQGSNITDSSITSRAFITSLYAAGDVSDDSSVSADSYYYSYIYSIITGGDFAGSVSSYWVQNVQIGFDSTGTRLAEDDDFTGSDFTGTLYAGIGLAKLSVTGRIEGAYISSGTGSIYNICAEDGFIDSTAYAAYYISRITVGYIDGLRYYLYVANYEADVSGTIATTYLGRIIYTGDILTDDEDNDLLDLSNVSWVGPIMDDIATVTIDAVSIDGEPLGEGEWSINNIPVPEGSGDTATVEITLGLSQISYMPIYVDYTTVAGTADSLDDDYQHVTETLIIPAGWTSGSFEITVTSDDIYEQDEMFYVQLQLSNPIDDSLKNAALRDDQAEITIVNDDSAPEIMIDNVSQTEGDVGTTLFDFEVSINLSNPTSLPIMVDYATVDGTALADYDYTSAAGTLTFEPGGLLSQTISVSVIGDTAAESDESFNLNIFGPVNATIASGFGTGVGTIEDDD